MLIAPRMPPPSRASSFLGPSLLSLSLKDILFSFRQFYRVYDCYLRAKTHDPGSEVRSASLPFTPLALVPDHQGEQVLRVPGLFEARVDDPAIVAGENRAFF